MFVDASFASAHFADSAIAAPFVEMHQANVASAPLRLWTGSVASNTSLGATKRGASGIDTSFGVTLRCTDAAPAADALYATAVTRTSPTNSGSLKEARALPSTTGTRPLQSASGLNRRVGTGLTRPSSSAPNPPPVFTPFTRSSSSPTTGRMRW